MGIGGGEDMGEEVIDFRATSFIQSNEVTAQEGCTGLELSLI